MVSFVSQKLQLVFPFPLSLDKVIGVEPSGRSGRSALKVGVEPWGRSEHWAIEEERTTEWARREGGGHMDWQKHFHFVLFR